MDPSMALRLKVISFLRRNDSLIPSVIVVDLMICELRFSGTMPFADTNNSPVPESLQLASIPSA